MHNALGSNASTRPLRVFLCHSSGDKPAVRKLYERLKADKIEPWLDAEDLLPGTEWEKEIPKAVRSVDVVIVCLSHTSITKDGYVQKEIKFALDVADEKPEGTIFIIPLKLEACEVPERLGRWHWVNFYEDDGYAKLMLALNARADSLGLVMAVPVTDQENLFISEDYENKNLNTIKAIGEGNGEKKQINLLSKQLARAEAVANWSEVIRFGEQILKINPRNRTTRNKMVTAYASRAKARLAGKRYEGAITDLNRAIELDPSCDSFYCLRGLCYWRKRKWWDIWANKSNQALTDITSALRLAPDNAEYYSTRASIFYFMKEYQAARLDLQRAVELGDEDAAEALKELL